jgi:Carbon-nitrogen hydrolase
MYQLDGAMHNQAYDGTSMPMPFPDALQEFKVDASGFSAAGGTRGSGGQVNAVTKSGTNDFHGNAFARHGAEIVFHPHFAEAEPEAYRPTTFADPLNTFHEKAMLCRAAENTCYFASVNCASPGSPTTSAMIRPDGTLLAYQPYGEEGLLIADIDTNAATGLLAARCRTAL